ncbi:MAG: hypothetical protein DDT34_02036 [Firmicutes bacterium]|nr:hypothetical protein [Bacillota bacterium]
MTKLYGIIADDLTGAGDTGAQFALAGLATRALFGDWGMKDLEGADAVVFNTDSRPLHAAKAKFAVASAATALVNAGVEIFFKKIDSTLRGPIGAEIDAVLGSTGLGTALVCPAFPANGRTVVGGYLLVEGQPVAKGAAGRDPVTPVTESYIPKLLAGQSSRPVFHCSLSDLEDGNLAAIICKAKEASGLLVCDATSDAHLMQIARVALDERQGLLFVGAAGLAAPLAQIVALESGKAKAVNLSKGVLTLVGSVNPVTREQVRVLMTSGAMPVYISTAKVFGPDLDQYLREVTAKAVAVVKQGKQPIVITEGEPADVLAAQQLGAERGLEAGTVAGIFAGALAKVAQRLLEEVPHVSIVATGGDVARATLAALGSNALDIVGEIAPGIPVCRLRGGSRPGLQIVTKAGGFGKPDVLVHAVNTLSKQA